MTSDPFLDFRSSKIKQMKGIDTINKLMRVSNVFIYVGGRYLKKTSHLVDYINKISRKMFSYGVI